MYLGDFLCHASAAAELMKFLCSRVTCPASCSCGFGIEEAPVGALLSARNVGVYRAREKPSLLRHKQARVRSSLLRYGEDRIT